MYREFRDQQLGAQRHARALPDARSRCSIEGQAERVDGELVIGNYFDVLGVRRALGRLFTPDDDQTPGGHPLAVLAYDYWMRRFAGDPAC